jgi:hypothetical protein
MVLLAVFLLALRDRMRRPKQDHARPLRPRPVEERIEEIRTSAASAIAELPGFRDQHARNYPGKEEAVSWIEPVIELYRRLEALAASRGATPQEARQLAEEARRFIRRRRLKGIFVDLEAKRLAQLLEERAARSENADNTRDR